MELSLLRRLERCGGLSELYALLLHLKSVLAGLGLGARLKVQDVF